MPLEQSNTYQYRLSRPAPLLHRLEADLQPVPRRLRESSKRARRWQTASAFEPRDRALCRLHAPGELGLTETRSHARLGDFKHQRELLLQRVVLLADRGVL